MSKELKESMGTMSHQIKKINRKIDILYKIKIYKFVF